MFELTDWKTEVEHHLGFELGLAENSDETGIVTMKAV